jgi:hypothetical protein
MKAVSWLVHIFRYETSRVWIWQRRPDIKFVNKSTVGFGVLVILQTVRELLGSNRYRGFLGFPQFFQVNGGIEA